MTPSEAFKTLVPLVTKLNLSQFLKENIASAQRVDNNIE
jgi:hypothetical protein